MRLNPECIRDVMLYLETVLIPDSHGDVAEIRPEKIAVVPSLSKYPQNELMYHIKQMFQSGLLLKGSCYISQDIAAIADITPNGYQFLDAIKNDKVWKKVISAVKNVGAVALPTLIELAVKMFTA